MKSTSPITQETNFNSISDKRERVNAMCGFCLNQANAFPAKCLEIAKNAYEIALKIGYGEGQSWALDHIAYQHWHLGKVDQALEELATSRKLQQKYSFYDQAGWHYEICGMILWSIARYDEAFTMIYDGIRLTDKHANKKEQGMLYWALGVFYYDLKDYDKSLANYLKAQEIIDKFMETNINAICYTLIGLGCCYKEKGDHDKALKYFYDAREKSIEGKQWMQEARTHYEIGVMLYEQGTFEEAENSLKKSYQMRKDYHTKPGMVSSLIALANLEVAINNMPKAMEYMEEALQIAIDTNTKAKIYKCHHKLYELRKKQNNYKKALEHLEEFHRLRSEVVGEEASNKLKDLETKYATEKSEREAEIERLRNVELKKAHDVITEKNREITDSIRYAKRIQNAILPPLKLVRDYMPESFILYKPKDIVAGDFYWLETIKEGDHHSSNSPQEENLVLFAAADCTGHGVPGAMVSVMCSNALSKAVNELSIDEPAKILDKTVELLEKRFSKSEEDVKDGMDIALCSLSHKEQNIILEYAGANNPLYIIRNNELIEIKPDKQPVGKHEGRIPFTNHTLELQKDDCLYIFTDGYADQFGGPKGKKFKYKTFKELLLRIHQQPMGEQNQILNDTIEEWKGELEQVDDICIMGLRI